jgi:hypothetical protein
VEGDLVLDEQTRVPGGTDPATPSVARMYDYFLGGKDNFAADRRAAAKVAETDPDVAVRARENREFLGRAVRFLVAAGVRQFIDLGTGLPTRENVHEVAQGAAPECRVVYVDNDPVVLAHARALLTDSAQTGVVRADVRRPEDVFGAPEVRQLIDFDRPVGILMVAILHFVPDEDRPGDIVARFRDRMAPGAHLVISHATLGRPGATDVDAARDVYASTTAGSITLRSPERLAALFDGFELVEPGVVHVAGWRPEDGPPGDTSKPYFAGGVGRR